MDPRLRVWTHHRLRTQHIQPTQVHAFTYRRFHTVLWPALLRISQPAVMQSPSHPGASAGAFLVLIEEDGQPQPLPDATAAPPPSTVTASPSAALHVPEFDWVQIRETWGGLRLYRHAPLDHYNGTRRGPSSQPSASPQPPPPPPPSSRPRQGLLLSGAEAEAGTALAREGGNEPEVLTPFRPARLSTVLLLDCRVPSSSDGSNGGDALPSAKVN